MHDFAQNNEEATNKRKQKKKNAPKSRAKSQVIYLFLHIFIVIHTAASSCHFNDPMIRIIWSIRAHVLHLRHQQFNKTNPRFRYNPLIYFHHLNGKNALWN